MVYTILIADRGFYAGLGYSGYSAMKKMTEETGGRLIDVGITTARKLEAAFQQIEDELRTQYVASYTPSNGQNGRQLPRALGPMQRRRRQGAGPAKAIFAPLPVKTSVCFRRTLYKLRCHLSDGPELVEGAGSRRTCILTQDGSASVATNMQRTSVTSQ